MGAIMDEEKIEQIQGENAAMFESSIAAKQAELEAVREELTSFGTASFQEGGLTSYEKTTEILWRGRYDFLRRSCCF